MHSNFGRVVTSEKKEERRGRDRVLAIFVTFSFLKKKLEVNIAFIFVILFSVLFWIFEIVCK